MLEVTEWLNGDQDYQAGVQLYRKWGKNGALLTLFQLPETSFTRSHLVKALEGLSPPAPDAEKEKEAVTPPPVLQLIRKRSQLHEELFHTRSTSDRHTISKAILAMGASLDRYYDDGKLPTDQAENGEKESPLPVNAWDLHMQLNNNIAYMAKNRKAENKQGEVKRRERQNSTIEERLKKMNYEPVS